MPDPQPAGPTPAPNEDEQARWRSILDDIRKVLEVGGGVGGLFPVLGGGGPDGFGPQNFGGSVGGAGTPGGSGGFQTGLTPDLIAGLLPQGQQSPVTQELVDLFRGFLPGAPGAGGPRRGGGGGGGGGTVNVGGGTPPPSTAGIPGMEQLLALINSGGQTTVDPRTRGQIDYLAGGGERGFADFQNLVGNNNPIMQMFMGQLARNNASAGQGQIDPMVFLSDAFQMATPDVPLRDLPPEVRDVLSRSTEARLAAQELEGGERQGRLLADLFGRGVNRSSLALNDAGRLSYGEDVLRSGIRSEGEQAMLQLMLGDQSLRGGLAEAALGANAGIRGAGISAAAGLAGQQGAQRAGERTASLDAIAQLFGSQSGALASAFGSSQQASSSALSDLTRLGLGEVEAGIADRQSRGDLAARIMESVQRLQGQQIGANAQVQAARIGARSATSNDAFSNLLGLLELQERGLGRQQQGQLGLLGLDTEQILARLRAATDLQIGRESRPEDADTWLRLLALAPTFIDAFNQGGG